MDHSDGDFARLTFQESAFGCWFDLSADTLTHVLLILGMAVTAGATGGPLMFVAGATATFGIVMCSLFCNLLLPQLEQPPRVARALLTLGKRDPFYLVLLSFAVLRWKAPWRFRTWSGCSPLAPRPTGSLPSSARMAQA